MLQRLANVVDRSLPEARFPDAEDRRRGRVLITGSMALAAVAFIVFINTMRSPSSQLVNYVGVGGLLVVFAAVPWVVRITGNVRTGGLWAVGWATVLLAALVASGGMRAPALSWIVFMPLIAHFFVGGAFAAVILAAAVASVSTAYAMTLAGHVFSISYQGDQLARLQWLSAIVFAITCTAVASLYDDARRRARRLQNEINERLRETNEHLARARDEAEAASQAKSTFLATVSHELRTPLHGILAMTGALRRQPLSPTSAEQVGIADRAAHTLNELIEDLLHLSEIEAGALQLQTKPWQLRRAIADVRRVFEPRATAKGLACRFHVADAVPAAVLLDGLRVTQVITNLIGNAIKFAERGEVTLSADWRRVPTTDDRDGSATKLVIEVADTGPGIAESRQESVFEPFTRVDNSPTRRHGGTGLGLAISRRLVAHMGGTLTLTSTLGEGCTFVVQLPCDAAVLPVVQNAPIPVAQVTARPRVLVADDSVICQQVLRQLLTPLGYDVAIVADGQAALERLTTERFDVVLMDCEMPLLDGISAVRQLRERAAAGDYVPVIAVTAHGLDEHRDVCMEAGMDDLLGKPFRLTELQAVLARWVEPPRDIARTTDRPVDEAQLTTPS